MGLIRSPAPLSWLPSRVADINQQGSVPDSLKLMTHMSLQGRSNSDGGLSSLLQDISSFGDGPEYGLSFSADNKTILDVPGGPVNLVDCRRTRISSSHPDALKRERKLVLGRLRQRRFREKMKRLREIHGMNVPAQSNPLDSD